MPNFWIINSTFSIISPYLEIWSYNLHIFLMLSREIFHSTLLKNLSEIFSYACLGSVFYIFVTQVAMKKYIIVAFYLNIA